MDKWLAINLLAYLNLWCVYTSPWSLAFVVYIFVADQNVIMVKNSDAFFGTILIAHCNLDVDCTSWAHTGISLPHYNVFQDQTCLEPAVCSSCQFLKGHADLDLAFYVLKFWGTCRQYQKSTIQSAHGLNIFLTCSIINTQP